ncbi:deoxyribodipyrimidine photo-lyase [bacterium]|nr:MAG: deoxyribodipyrimidine photo-lyase [bacterium]
MPSRMRRALCWIRRDLRLSDHAALASATEAADEVGVVFVFDTNILDSLADRDDRRVSFIHRSLFELDARLKAQGSRLIVRHGDPLGEILATVEEYGAEAVFAARDYEPYARARDGALATQIPLHLVRDSVIFEPEELTTEAGTHPRQHRSFKIAWQKAFRYAERVAPLEPDLTKLLPLEKGGWLGLPSLGFVPSEVEIKPGEAAAQERLLQFQRKVRAYEVDRNFPAVEGTSVLSVDLRFGTISTRACLRAALDGGMAGEKWLSELIWRDYYQHILFHFPAVVDAPFRDEFAALDYPGSEGHFEAWTEGKTGYPLIDAGMRCLRATGWMNNRLRMATAGFLAKNLLVDYRKGEAWFARYLLDFDLAANNGNWQWAASVGSDAQPFFRSFNPILQSEKFDPEGTFIRRWVPELAKLPTSAIHAPGSSPLAVEEAGIRLGIDYPLPIVDQKATRDRSRAFLTEARTAQKG